MVPSLRIPIQKTSVQFVKSVIKKYLALKRPNLSNPTKAGEAQCLMKYLEKKPSLAPSFQVPLEDPRKIANLQKLKIEEEMRNGENVKIAKSLGFNEKKIKYFDY